MAVSRTYYYIFYILYLITLGVGLWFLLYYSGVPSWVWIFFGAAILITIISVLMKEFLLVGTITTSGKYITNDDYAFWVVLYMIFNITVFILIIVGLIFVIKYSSIPWWVWLILSLGILFSIIGDMLMIFGNVGYIFSLIFNVISLILFIVGVGLVIVYSHAPWWVWLIVGIAILFAIIAGIFENINGSIQRNNVTTSEKTVVTQGVIYNASSLPTYNIPRQII